MPRPAIDLEGRAPGSGRRAAMSRRFTKSLAFLLLVTFVPFAARLTRGEEPDPDAAIRLALAQKVKVEFSEAPLSKALRSLTEGKLEMVIDRKALNDAGLNLDEPVTARTGDVTLQRALKVILNDF